MRVIDSEMINQLSLVAEMTDRIRLSDSDKHSNPDEVDPDEYKPFFPLLTILVRDVDLQLKDDQGKDITPDEYL